MLELGWRPLVHHQTVRWCPLAAEVAAALREVGEDRTVTAMIMSSLRLVLLLATVQQKSRPRQKSLLLPDAAVLPCVLLLCACRHPCGPGCFFAAAVLEVAIAVIPGRRMTLLQKVRCPLSSSLSVQSSRPLTACSRCPRSMCAGCDGGRAS